MPRFVILEHESPRGRHWDLMLQSGEVLTTWALSLSPDAPGPIPAEALPDHRLAYLDYEGPVSGGRGTVARWDHGQYEIQRRDPDELALLLHGHRLAGRALLARSPDAPAQWTFRLVADG